MELTLIRHGQSTNNAQGDEQRHPDPELTELGHDQAKRLAKYLVNSQNGEEIVRLRSDSEERQARHPFEFTHIYVSAMRRALQTANPISRALGIQPHVWPEVHESGGLYLHTPEGVQVFPGMTRAEMTADFPGYILTEAVTDEGWYRSLGGEEDLYGCYARAMRVARSLRERSQNIDHHNDKIAIVSHGNFIVALINALLDNLPSDNLYFWHYNTAFTRIDFPLNGLTLVRYVNRCDHLPAELLT